ncbi:MULTISPECIES: 50S ribosomal protein L28 [unclassified Persephonella]|uniref:50S ribosomal protein L28 n=1 Tax=unclassified Persephonella TaxID=2641955 RepID=UPI0004979F61|nr:50S ribosomal protein L28 [Persephonella sp. KM09-Lau-8]
MAVCQICGKKTAHGNRVAHSATTSKRVWRPNLQRVRAVMPDGSTKRIYVCAKCLKAGKVKKAVR